MGKAAHKALLPLHGLVELRDGPLHPLGHGVEVGGHGGDLVLAADGDPAGEVPRGDGPGSPGQPRQRRGQQPRHGVGRNGAQQGHHAEYPQIGLLLAAAHGIEAGDSMGCAQAELLPVGLHRCG